MSGTFEPRAVDKSSSLRWIKEGVELSTRAFVRNAMVALLFMLPYFLVKDVSGLLKYMVWIIYPFVAIPSIVAYFFMSAESVDRGKKLILVGNMKLLKGIYKLAFVYGLIISTLALLLIFVVSIIGMNNIIEDSSSFDAMGVESFLRFEPGEKIANALFLFLGFGLFTWFMPGIYCSEGIGLRHGFGLAKKALVLNSFMYGFTALLSIFMLIIAQGVSGILMIPLLSILGSVMYVSYIDVFLAKAP